MSRTTRKFMTDGNYREARRGRITSDRVWDDADFRFADTGEPVRGDYDRHERIRSAALPSWGHRSNHGGLLASPSCSGFWAGEVYVDHSVLRQRERRAFLRAAEADLAAEEALDAAEFWRSDQAAEAADYERQRAREDYDGFYVDDERGWPVFVGPTHADHVFVG